MNYEEIQEMPLTYLLGYIADLYADITCTCSCQKELYLSDKWSMEDAKRYAKEREEQCKRENKYDKCPQRLAFERIKEALEKQTQKKPIPKYVMIGKEKRLVSYKCPCCDNETLGNNEYKFDCCEDCGQALNWEESDCETKDEGNKDFVFDYGIVEYQHRFSITRSLDDYEVTTLNKCIRMGIQYKYYTMACDKLIAEMQITYKDENNKLHCFTADLHDFTFSIKHKGDMQIDL